MIKDVKSFVKRYAAFDEPIPFKGLLIYPILLKQYYDFKVSYDILCIEKDKIRNAAIPLLESVIQNTQYKAGKDALTGPLKRGDENTIRMHLQSLEKDMPGLVEIYKTLGR